MTDPRPEQGTQGATPPHGDPLPDAGSPEDFLAGAADAAPAREGQEPEDGDEGTGATADPVSDPAAEAQARVGELTEALQRVQAEFVNYKRRVERDREQVAANASARTATAMLAVMDDIDRAREHGEVTGGFKAVADSLTKVVESLGLQRFGAPGEEFDPTRHEAVSHGQSDEVESTVVDKVLQAGWAHGERVVRAAMVTVVGPS